MKSKNIENQLEYYSDELFGYNDMFSKFINLYNNNKLPKNILISGEKGIGKFTFIFHLINSIFSKNAQIKYDNLNFKINKDSDIYKKIFFNVDANFNYLSCEGPNTVSIDDIRNLKTTLSKTPINNTKRFTIIDDIELINLNCSNALLKLVEEPSSYDFFIFINNKKQKVIETLYSRSIEFKIFFSYDQKTNIFDNIKKKFNLKDNFLDNYIKYSTPGNLIKFNEILEKNEIYSLDNFEENIYKLLTIFKKNKNLICIDLIFLFLDIKFMKLQHTNSENFLRSLELKNKIINLFNDHYKFNLSISNVFDQFKSYIKHAR